MGRRLMPYSFTASSIQGTPNVDADELSRLSTETFEKKDMQFNVSILANRCGYVHYKSMDVFFSITRRDFDEDFDENV